MDAKEQKQEITDKMFNEAIDTILNYMRQLNIRGCTDEGSKFGVHLRPHVHWVGACELPTWDRWAHACVDERTAIVDCG